MPRRPTDKPTYIYWLLDTRPQTIAAGWSSGLPFYCGKTDRSTTRRLIEHKGDARRAPYGKVAPRLLACGEHVHLRVMEIVPAGGDWHARESRWIWVLREHFPDTVNVSSGGGGASGVVRSAEWRAKASARRKGIQLSSETREKIAAANRGKKASSETRAKLSAVLKARWSNSEYRKTMSNMSLSTWADPTIRAKRRAHAE